MNPVARKTKVFLVVARTFCPERNGNSGRNSDELTILLENTDLTVLGILNFPIALTTKEEVVTITVNHFMFAWTCFCCRL